MKSHYLDDFLGEMKRQAYLTLIKNWVKLPSKCKVLKTDLFEEAMGPDSFLTAMCKDGRTIVGLDISKSITRRARQKDPDLHASYIVADVRHLPFAKATFALIVSPSTLDHFKDPSDLKLALKQLTNIMEPRGKLIITMDNRQNLFDPLLRFTKWLRLLPYYIGRSYTVNELRKELNAVGLKVLDTTAILHNPRLLAVLPVAVVNKIKWNALIKLVRHILISAQKLGKTRWCYYTGSFVAALASHREEEKNTN